MINIPKGTKDVLPQDSYKWQFVEEKAREIAALYNVKEIRTPVFEHTEVFLRGVGDTTDIVNKEMYTFLDKGNRSITLKPEGTAGVARAFIENGMASLPMPVKTFYITPCFRYERPQAGRLREFHQFGVEILGSSAPETDAETIAMAKEFLNAVGVTKLTLKLNSIGCKDCRPNYEKALREYLKGRYDELCDLCKDRYERNPLRILDCKNEECKRIIAGAPKIADFLCDDCKKHFERVKTLLTGVGLEFTIDPDIVRGLDYYTKTVFEFVSEEIGAQGTVLGGGRYDRLIADLGGSDVKGIGFAAGIERLLLVLENSGKQIPEKSGVKIYFAPMGERESEVAFTLAEELRKKGMVAETDIVGRGIKSQFKYADKIGAEYVAVIGSDELEKGKANLKKMSDGSEKEVDFRDIYEFIK
ncbi:MAG: histidine--tRNA ligase [Clostridia bacterium]|nr:histidine--tRNA ligase [Clostridia bacterium]